MKNIIITIMLLAIVIGGTGCMFKYPAENINDIAIDYLEKKYDKEFEYSAPFGDSLSGTHQLIAKCDELPNQSILVSIENYNSKDRIFFDNYLAVYYRFDTSDLIKEIAKQTYNEVNVFYKVSTTVLSPELSADASFEVYLSDSSAEIHPVIEVKASCYGSAEKIKELADNIMKRCGCYYVSVVFVDDDEYGLSDFEAMKSRMGSGNFVHCAKITGDLNEYEVRWLEEE